MWSRADRYFAATASFALLALVLSFVAVGAGVVALTDEDGREVAAGEPVTLEITLGDLFVEPSSITVPAGAEVTLVVTNDGAMPHDLQLADGTGTPMLDPGQSVEQSFGVVAQTTQAWCTVPGHKEAGMVLDIIVEGSAASGGATGQDASSGRGDAATIDFDAAPEADWQPFDPTLQPAPGGTVHDLTLRATETVLEVAPGVEQQMWTFDDQVPGPVLRGKVGDIFNVTLVNDGEVGHS
ncbi:MAG TPA: hypothetical protein VFK43_17930, partial [Acidimicrobiales bacterium]|nr:hypothetical protein [Acidimicrobiales bacterium]